MSPSVATVLLLSIIVATAITIAMNRRTREFGFATWVVAAVLVALIYPPAFLAYLPLPYKDTLTLLLQIAMFGTAANLATGVLRREKAALAPAIFAPVMNVSGSILATIWSRSPIIVEQTNHSDQSKSPDQE